MGNDFYRMISEFHSNASLARGCNASFIVLIPKKDNPVSLNDYRPISLVGCIYKVIAKLLPERLNRVLPSVISENQSAFLKGRNIADGVVVLNELLDYPIKKGETMLGFQGRF